MAAKVSDRRIRGAIRAQLEGASVSEVCRSLGVSRATFHRRKADFVMPKPDPILAPQKRQNARQRSLSAENTRLRHMLAEANLKVDMFQNEFGFRGFPADGAGKSASHLYESEEDKKTLEEGFALSYLDHSVDFAIWDDPDEGQIHLSEDVKILQSQLLETRDAIAYCISQLGRVATMVILASLVAKLGGWKAYYTQIQRNLPPEERVGGDGSKFMIGDKFAYCEADRKEIEKKIRNDRKAVHKINRSGLQQLFQDYFKLGSSPGYCVQLIAAEATGLDDRTIRQLFTQFQNDRGRFYDVSLLRRC